VLFWSVKYYNIVLDMETKKIDLLCMTQKELEKELKIPKFKAIQIYKWVHKKGVENIGKMTDLSLDMRKSLEEKFFIFSPKIKAEAKSKDKSVKYLLEMPDKSLVETVHMPEAKGRLTVCVSSQIGCSLGCKFCATAMLGFGRNLSVSEILSQVYLSKDVSNVVFMGMGEPFLNYDNVIKSIEFLNSENGLNIGARKITVSTAGIPSGIRKFSELNWQVRLAVSLNSADEKKRSELMPITNKYSLKSLKEAIIYYQMKTKRRITFEYIMLKGVNDTEKDLLDLLSFVEGIDANINLIPYNKNEFTPFSPSDNPKIDEFIFKLKNKNIEAVKRVSHGQDVNAACGQLALKI